MLEQRGNDLSSLEKEFVHLLLSHTDSKEKDGLLSDREIEVLQVLSTGASNKEIAERLCISLSTVKTHIINIYSKLHVSNRLEAVKTARTKGILD